MAPPAERRHYTAWSPLRLVAAAAVIAVLVCGIVLAFATPDNPLDWVAAGLVAAGVALAYVIGFL